MAATLHHLPVTQPQPAPFPVMSPSELADFWVTVAMLRAERALMEHAEAGCAAVLAASRGKCCTGIYCHCASGCLCGCGSCGCRPWPSS